MEGVVKEIIGEYCYADFPERAKQGLNSETSIKLSNLEQTGSGKWMQKINGKNIEIVKQ